MEITKETTIESKLEFNGTFINLKKDQVQLNNGEKHYREVVVHPGGVAVVAITDKDKIILVKQWRYAVNDELIELPAGKLEENEDPFFAIKRELQEETGFIANNWESLGFIYTAPGFCNEKLYLYKATNLTFVGTNFDEGEVIQTFKFSFKEVEELIKEGKILDAKTLVGLNKVMSQSSIYSGATILPLKYFSDY